MDKKFKTLIKAAVGVLILLLLFYKVGFVEVYNSFLKINIVYIPIVIVLFAIFLFLSALNFFVLTRGITSKMKFSKIFKYSLWSWGYGKFLPGKIGEFSLVYFFKKQGISVGQSTVIVLVDKIISFIVLFLIASLGFVFFLDVSAVKVMLIVLAAFIIAMLFIFTEFGRGLIKRFILRKYSKIFTGFSKNLFFLLRKNWWAVVLDFIITFLRWGIDFLLIYLLFLSVGQELSYLALSAVVAASSILALVPVSISGLGVRESVGVVMLYQLGIGAALAAGILVIETAISYIFALVVVFSHLFKKS